MVCKFCTVSLDYLCGSAREGYKICLTQQHPLHSSIQQDILIKVAMQTVVVNAQLRYSVLYLKYANVAMCPTSAFITVRQYVSIALYYDFHQINLCHMLIQ